MRHLAQQFLDLLRKRAWLKKAPKTRGRSTLRLHLECLEDRFAPATSVNQLLPAALTGTVFVDHNHDNTLDPGDPVVPGATVTLSGKTVQGTSVKATAVTNANGVYTFMEVDPGTYQVSLTTNAQLVSGSGTAGSAGGIVSGTVVSSISIAEGQTLVGYNLAVEGLASAGVSLRDFLSTTILVNGIPTINGTSVTGTPGSGMGYADSNVAPPAILTAVGTGSLAGSVIFPTGTTTAANTTSTDLPIVTLGLTGVTGGGANGGLPTFTTTTTNSSGDFTFSDLAAGTYTINVVSQPTGFVGTPASITAASESGTTVTITTAAANSFTVGQQVDIAGITPAGYDGGVTIASVPSPTTFTYSAASGLAAATLALNAAATLFLPVELRAGTPAIGTIDGYILNNDTLAGIDVTTTAGTGYNFNETTVTEPTGTTPDLDAHLVDDTAGANGTTSDGLTNDPTVGGVIANVGTITSFTGKLDSGSTITLPAPSANGSFLISPAFMNELAGGTLANGAHTLSLSATGTTGTASATVSFTLESSITPPTVHLDITSDPAQDGRPIQNNVTIMGVTADNAEVELLSGGSLVGSTNSDSNGNFSFAQTLTAGPNNFVVHVTDNAGNQAETDVTYVVDQAPVASTIANVTVTQPAANQNIDLASDFTDPDTSDSIVQFQTTLGDINVQLNDAQDPQTVTNFLDYIKSGAFANSIFHRSVSGFVLQGGGFTLNATVTPPAITPIITGPDVNGEAPATPPTGGSNIRGTIAMALSNGPNTGNSQYFFNLANNSSTLDGTTDGGPFTVFGTIADGFSQRIVDDLAAIPVTDESSAAGAAINTVQTVTLNGAPTGGTFYLDENGTASTPIAYNASASAAAAAIAGLPAPTGTGTIGAANVSVTGTPGNWTVTFIGDLAGTSVAQLGSFSNLSGGNSPSVTVTVVTPGSSTNSALTDLPLQNYTGTSFPTGATASNLATIQNIQIIRNTEFLTYSVTGNTNPGVASATLVPNFNSDLTLQFLTPGTTLITVTATDPSGKTASTTFTVTVNAPTTNVAPVINNQNFTVAQGAATGTNVGLVQATNPLPGQTLTYSIVNGSTPATNSDSTFTIGGNGELSVASTDDLTSGPKTFTLTVQATNASTSLSSTATITVTVVSGAPTIANQTFTAAAGSASGTVLGTVAATSAPGQVLTYAITGGNVNNPLQINSTTGQLTVNTSSALVAGTPISATVTVTATNATPATASGTITVDLVPEAAPTIANQTFNLPANTSNSTTVGTVQASAAGVGQTLTYAITAGNTGGTFQIDPNSGIITVVNNTVINTGGPFVLTVQVTDNNTVPANPAAGTATVTINVASDPPQIAAQFFSVTSGAPNGTVVGTVVASTVDAGQTITAYAITGGNTGNTFQINSTTGQITVANNTVMNTAANPTFTLTVQVTDNGAPPMSASNTMTITLTGDIPPNLGSQSLNVLVGSADGAVVGTVVASDPIQGQTLTYAITAGNTNNTFAINSTTGQITVNDNTDLTTANSPFQLTVQTTDDNQSPLSTSATVTVNVVPEAPPTIANQTFNLAANTATGATVGTVQASPAASAETLTYAITGGNTGNTFQINPSTGVITVANNAIINTGGPFSLTVQATDNNSTPMSSSATMTINVANDAPVINAQTLAVTSGAPNGSVVGTVAANDPDVGQTLTYAITGGNTGTTFQINSATGQITVASNAVMNTASNPTYSLTVQVTDNGAPAMSSSATITTNLTPDSAPSISNQTFSVPAASPVGTVVGTVAASDPIQGQTLTYAITAGNTNNTFAINSTTGQITVANNTDLTAADSPFQLTVQVTDDNQSPLSSSATVTVNVM